MARSLESRLSRLEDEAGYDAGTCPACGWPEPWVDWRPQAELDAGIPPPVCLVCGHEAPITIYATFPLDPDDPAWAGVAWPTG